MNVERSRMGYLTPKSSEVSAPESQDCSTGDREMAQLVKHLLCKCEDVSSNLRTHFKPGAVGHICNLSTPVERWGLTGHLARSTAASNQRVT